MMESMIVFCFCGAQSLLVGDISFVWWVQVCQNDACHQCSLLYFSLIHIYNQIFFLVIPLLSHGTRYSWSYGHLIFFIQGYGGPKVCDAESLFLLLFLLYFSLIRFLHSIFSLILPLLCRGSMYSLSYGYLNFFRWRSVTQKGIWPQIITVATFPPVFFINSFLVLYYLSNVTFSVLWEYVLFEFRLFEIIFFGDMWREKVCDPESLLSLLFLLYFSIFCLLHYIRSLTTPSLCRGSTYSLSYSCLKIFYGEMWRKR
jgi:hypothetical protein